MYKLKCFILHVILMVCYFELAELFYTVPEAFVTWQWWVVALCGGVILHLNEPQLNELVKGKPDE